MIHFVCERLHMCGRVHVRMHVSEGSRTSPGLSIALVPSTLCLGESQACGVHLSHDTSSHFLNMGSWDPIQVLPLGGQGLHQLSTSPAQATHFKSIKSTTSYNHHSIAKKVAACGDQSQRRTQPTSESY